MYDNPDGGRLQSSKRPLNDLRGMIKVVVLLFPKHTSQIEGHGFFAEATKFIVPSVTPNFHVSEGAPLYVKRSRGRLCHNDPIIASSPCDIQQGLRNPMPPLLPAGSVLCGGVARQRSNLVVRGRVLK